MTSGITKHLAFVLLCRTKKLFYLKGMNIMYDKVSPNLNFVEREKKTEKFWEDNHIFQKSIDERKNP